MRNYVVRHVDSYWHHTCSVDDDAFHMFRLIFVSAQTILRIGAKRRHTEHHSSRARITDEHACLFFFALYIMHGYRNGAALATFGTVETRRPNC
jgi:hypothetical protein